jgi:hypothetical protein
MMAPQKGQQALNSPYRREPHTAIDQMADRGQG